MPGQYLSLIILLTFVLTGCGGPSHVDGAPRFIKGQIITPGPKGVSVRRNDTRTFKDYDGDRISDRLDADIDEDGVPNLADQYPFDETRSGEDKDRDGVADFIDLDDISPELAQIQEEIFQKTGITIINGSENFATEEWKQFKEALLNPEIAHQFAKLKTIVRYSKSDQPNLNRADFDPYWYQISFYPNPAYDKNAPGFMGGLIHELGHVHAAENPDVFETFMSSTLPAVSKYALTSPEEAYAEHYAYDFFVRGIFVMDPSRFDLMPLAQEF